MIGSPTRQDLIPGAAIPKKKVNPLDNQINAARVNVQYLLDLLLAPVTLDFEGDDSGTDASN